MVVRFMGCLSGIAFRFESRYDALLLNSRELTAPGMCVTFSLAFRGWPHIREPLAPGYLDRYSMAS